MNSYDPFAAGTHSVSEQELQLVDEVRNRKFPATIWVPDTSAAPPLIAYSHRAGGNRRAATFLAAHLASHGYAVAALDHSEIVDPAFAGRSGETPAERASRVESIIANRVPDLRLLLDVVLRDVVVDPDRVGLVGHSFGGWTALSTPDVDRRPRSIVAHAPGGASAPPPGVLFAPLKFGWNREIPTLYLAADHDVPIPVESVADIYTRTPSAKRMFVLRNADHAHFIDDVETVHEETRLEPISGDAAWMPAAMLPMSSLVPKEPAHTFVRGLTLAHLDATLRERAQATEFLDGDVIGALAARGVDAY